MDSLSNLKTFQTSLDLTNFSNFSQQLSIMPTMSENMKKYHSEKFDRSVKEFGDKG